MKLPDDPKPVPARDIRHRGELERAALHAEGGKRLANDGMLEFPPPGHALGSGMLGWSSATNVWWSVMSTCLLDRGRDKGYPAVFLIIGRQVGATATEGNAQVEAACAAAAADRLAAPGLTLRRF